MGKKKDNKKLDKVEKDGKGGKLSKIIYICFTMIFIVGIGLCFYYIFDQTRNKAVWSVASEEEIKKESFFNRDCAEILENIPNGQITYTISKKNCRIICNQSMEKFFIAG